MDCKGTEIAVLIFIVFSIILEIITIPMMYFFIKRYHATQTNTDKLIKVHKKLFWTAIPFLILTLIAIPNQIPYVMLLKCSIHQEGDDRVLNALSFTLTTNAAMYFVMQIFWFLRLYYGFKDSVLALNKYTVILYMVLFSVLIIIFVPVVIGYHWVKYQYWSALLSFWVFINVCLAISFSILFAIKLSRAHREYDGNYNAVFLVTINKITVLSLLSLLITIIAISIGFIRISILANGDRSNLLDFVSFYANLLDNYTNFLSVILSFTFFERLYMILLGKVDKCFRCCCWNKLLSIQHEKNMIIELKTVNSRSNSPVVSTPEDDHISTDFQNEPATTKTEE